ncbi:Transient receptor potential cation channel subfamily V member 1 [Labeo rohita]|uniref:Transient receptor potential cation channel subfamily V member 1 n=1 Tax=Labeo rohita TaxID=84645 RepID=A0ABQ8LCR4_LABRO|nr:Transient receptor potential cation channel subfamily V member 1 [Labeo rohita]
MTSANQDGADRHCYDPSNADGGTHDTHTTHERLDTQPAAGTGKGSRCPYIPETALICEHLSAQSVYWFHGPRRTCIYSQGKERSHLHWAVYAHQQHICEELKHLTQEGLKPDVKVPTPTPAQAFTDESTAVSKPRSGSGS